MSAEQKGGGVAFECPFCSSKKGQVIAVSEPPSVMHNQPTCAKFEALEPDEFLAQCREFFEKDLEAKKS